MFFFRLFFGISYKKEKTKKFYQTERAKKKQRDSIDKTKIHRANARNHIERQIT